MGTHKAILLNHIYFPRTPLSRAAAANHSEVCQFLIDSGANVDARDLSFVTAFHLCAYQGHTQVCKVLLQSGANYTLYDGSG